MFTVIHTSDWHIGMPFRGFENDVPGLLRQARVDGINRIADIARREGGSHVLVAGDTFDGPLLADLTFRSVLTRLGQHADLVWHLIPGNHDPDVPGGIFDRLARLDLPANVHLHRTAEPVEISPRVVLLPAPLKARASAIDPTRWMDEAATPDGTLRIGLAHGGTQDFSALSSRAAATAEPISPKRAQSAGLAYLALGDWHGLKRIAPDTWYSGTHEPDAFAANARGQVLVARFEGTRLVSVEPVQSSHFTWAELPLRIVSLDDLSPLESMMVEVRASGRPHLLRLALSGAATLDERAEIERRIERITGDFVAVETDLEGLAHLESADVRQAFSDRRLGDIAARLADTANADPQSEAARIAGQAIRLLHRYAAEERGAASAVAEGRR